VISFGAKQRAAMPAQSDIWVGDRGGFYSITCHSANLRRPRDDSTTASTKCKFRNCLIQNVFRRQMILLSIIGATEMIY
jgi:hypothetical protein